jgi:hypothetical protein
LGERVITFLWGFGAPGHGKGEWDGMFGWLKSFVRRTIIAAETKPDVIKTKSGKIKDARDVLEHFEASYDTEVWRAKQAAKIKRHISSIKFLWAGAEDILRPKLPEHFEAQKGVRTLYEWLVLGNASYASRRFACHCSPCLSAKCRGNITPSAQNGYPSTTPLCKYVLEPSFFGWSRCSCKHIDKGKIAATRAISQRSARLLVPELEAGVWVFCQARGCRHDDWWLGRAVDVDDNGFGGKCFRKFTAPTTHNGVKFRRGDYGIAVQWYERIPSDPARLEFAMDEDKVCLINGTELRQWRPYGDVERTRGPAVAIYRSQREYSRAAQAEHAARAHEIDERSELKRTYRVSLETAQLVIDANW